MRRQIITVEDFYPAPLKVRNFALSCKWIFPYAQDSGVEGTPTWQKATKTWMTTERRLVQDTVFRSKKMISVLESITGDEIDREKWFEQPTKWNGLFHVKTHATQTSDQAPNYNPQKGAGIHSHTIDNSNPTGEDGWAGIVYLNPEASPETGLSLWKPLAPVDEKLWTIHFKHDNFQLVDSIGNTFNRLVLVRGNIWHSGASGWGDSVTNGRMFQTFFFSVKGRLKEPVNASLELSDLPEPLTAGSK